MKNEYKNILVPVDYSSITKELALKAAEIAIRNNGRIDFLNVINTNFSFTFGAMDGNQITYTVNDHLKTLKKLASSIKRETGFTNIHIHVRFGNPKNVIAFDFPKEYHNDLIMIGNKSKKRTPTLMGSVASFVNLYAPCDVMTVKPKTKA